MVYTVIMGPYSTEERDREMLSSIRLTMEGTDLPVRVAMPESADLGASPLQLQKIHTVDYRPRLLLAYN